MINRFTITDVNICFNWAVSKCRWYQIHIRWILLILLWYVNRCNYSHLHRWITITITITKKSPVMTLDLLLFNISFVYVVFNFIDLMIGYFGYRNDFSYLICFIFGNAQRIWEYYYMLYLIWHLLTLYKLSVGFFS